MAATALGLSRPQWVQVLGGSAFAFGVTGLLAPRVIGSAYGVPPSPHSTQLIRLFGTRMLAIAAWTFSARTREETNRALAVATAMNVADALTALGSARSTGGATALRSAATSGVFAGLTWVVRSLDD
ncbi:DUF4267 domain-containing protein [Candidatus Blastococcus massiliensis]|uniref:DUF4267 domain-containing protein n=1 Tax=Candidatus Blastococcus massiliensis TaxID=1470358 RepID=UPI0004B2A8FB|nr:DUF4267 domain-containing protein [Candidatus Blastococcus massiliensis]